MARQLAEAGTSVLKGLSSRAERAPASPERTPRRNAVIAWDTETTGFGEKGRIIEIALREVFVSNGEEAREFSMLINPGQRVPNVEVHGISDEMLDGKPRFAEAWRRVRKFVEDCAGPGGEKPILVAHYGQFDKGMLGRELQRLGLSMPDWHFACSIRHVFKIVWPAQDSYKLRELCEKLKIENEAEHRALGDTRVLCRLLEKADEKLLSVEREVSTPRLRSDSQDSPSDSSDDWDEKGDAVRSLVLRKLASTSTKPKKKAPNPVPVTRPTAESVLTTEYGSSLICAVPGGGFFCTVGGEVFHVDHQCRGLRKANYIYEIAGPPSGRRGCYQCAANVSTRNPAKPVAEQVDAYLRSKGAASQPIPLTTSSSSAAKTEETQGQPHTSSVTQASKKVDKRSQPRVETAAETVPQGKQTPAPITPFVSQSAPIRYQVNTGTTPSDPTASSAVSAEFETPEQPHSRVAKTHGLPTSARSSYGDTSARVLSENVSRSTQAPGQGRLSPTQNTWTQYEETTERTPSSPVAFSTASTEWMTPEQPHGAGRRTFEVPTSEISSYGDGPTRSRTDAVARSGRTAAQGTWTSYQESAGDIPIPYSPIPFNAASPEWTTPEQPRSSGRKTHRVSVSYSEIPLDEDMRAYGDTSANQSFSAYPNASAVKESVNENVLSYASTYGGTNVSSFKNAHKDRYASSVGDASVHRDIFIITRTGRRFHKEADCRGLSRAKKLDYVYEVPPGLTPCKFCACK